MDDEAWVTTEAAAARLGVKPNTLYAYVSRGLLRSERIPGSRRSRFARADVERLAASRRAGGRAGGLEVIIDTDLTMLDPAGRLTYRGWDVGDAVAEGASFEEVATWLWGGQRSDEPFVASPEAIEAGRTVARHLGGLPRADLMRTVVAAVRHTDPLRDDLRPVAVAATARGLIAAVVDSLPCVGATDSPAPSGRLAERLWPRLSPLPVTAARVDALNAALVLLADHELAASTLAARVAASTWADPYLVTLAGLAALGGPLHGGATAHARVLIADVDAGEDPAVAIGRRLRGGGQLPGFGHRVYTGPDPRAETLLAVLARVVDLDTVEGLIATAAQRELGEPNVDLAVATLAEVHQMVDDAGELIFAIARTAGWLAHAGEEYAHRLRYRARAVYTGPPSR